MSKLPESLRRVLAGQPKAEPVTPLQFGTVTTIWRDGEVYRQSPGRAVRQLQSIRPVTP